MSSGAQGSRAYRPEIDGLRALAVLAVIVGHFDKSLLPNGYLGVDIFFVISGYVITSSLASRKEATFSSFIGSFYLRRIKRLVPALLVFVLVTSVLISLFDPNPAESLSIGWRALLGIANIKLFQNSTNYFSSSADLNPFTHMWSLGVEEQFYLLFPLVVWFTGFASHSRKGQRNALVTLSLMSAVSLGAFAYIYQLNFPAAYFLAPYRFWEIAIGAILFILSKQYREITLFSTRCAAGLPLLAIVAVMIFLSPELYPVIATIAIVLLTAMVIASLRPDSLSYKILTSPQALYIGSLSYSLYLWHWTVLVISRWTIGISLWTVPIQVVVMFLMAHLSFVLVEKPFRNARWNSGVRLSLQIALALGVSVVGIKYLKDSARNYLYLGNSETARQSGKANLDEYSTSIQSHSDSRPSFLLIGDSHAVHLLPLVKELALINQFNYSILATPGVPTPRINGNWIEANAKYLKNNYDENPHFSNNFPGNLPLYLPSERELDVISSVANLPSDSVVILSSRHFSMYRRFFVDKGRKYYQSLKSDTGQLIGKEELIRLWKDKISAIVRAAAQKKNTVVFMLPLPEFTDELLPARICSTEWFRPEIHKDCESQVTGKKDSKARFIPEFYGAISELEDIYSNFRVFDGTDFICRPSNEFCSPQDNGKRMYWDNDHLSVRGAMKLVKPFGDYLYSQGILSNIDRERFMLP